MMGLTYLREAGDDDEAFLFDVFCTTWETEIAALPNPNLAQHVLRIQYTAQNSRFEGRYPDLERYVVVHDGVRVGRMYLQRTATAINIVDMTLLPPFRSRGIGTGLVKMALAEASQQRRPVTLRVARRNTRARSLYGSLGFRLVTMDDIDLYFEWSPEEADAELGNIADELEPTGLRVAPAVDRSPAGTVSSHSVP